MVRDAAPRSGAGAAVKVDLPLLRTIAGGSPDDSNMRSALAGLERFGQPAGLDLPHRLAHYLAQLLHESGRFRYDQEVWGPTPAQRRYEDRADLGHSAAVPGEAFAFRGRAGIQLTGRANYRAFRDWCRRRVDTDAPDFEKHPDAVNTDPWEGLAPIWYWDAGNPTGKSLNVYADRNDPEAVTRKINGGLNGYQDRLSLYTRTALVLLGYTLERGAVLAFQRAAGFTGRDLDDIPGQRTRAAMHGHLKAAERLAFGPDPAASHISADLLGEIGRIHELVAEADRRLEALGTG